MTPLLSIRGLTVAYPGAAPALEGLDLDLAEGERLAVLGESGSGKSTLALAVAGLLPPDCRIDGRIGWPGGQVLRPGRDIGFVFQDAGASLNPVARAGAQIGEVLRAHFDMTRAEASIRADRLLARVDLEGAARAYPGRLSGGQRQRVGLALAIAAGPRLLIADEPTSALDTITQARIAALIAALVREDGMALLFITHDIALAATLADRILVLRHARMVEEGAAARILEAPADPYTRALRAAHLELEPPPSVQRTP